MNIDAVWILMMWADYDINSLAPGKSGCYLRNTSFNIYISLWLVALALSLHIFWDGFLWILLMIGLQLEQVMVWCLMAPSNYLIQCWHRIMMLYGLGLHSGDCFEGIGCAEGCQCGSFQWTQNGDKIVINTSILFHWSHFELSIWHDISDVGTYCKIITVKSLI